MSNPFKHLDLKQQIKFKKIRKVLAFYYGALIAIPVVFFWNDLLSSQYGVDFSFYLSPLFLFCLLVTLSVCTCLAFAKYKRKKIEDISKAGYFRDTKGIFDFDDPVSILEVLILCNDYAGGVNLGIDLDNDSVKRLIINTMIKSGAIVEISPDEIVVNDKKLAQCGVGKELMEPYLFKFPNLVNDVYRRVFFELPSCPKKDKEKKILEASIKPFAFEHDNLVVKDDGNSCLNLAKSLNIYKVLIEILRSVAAENRKFMKDFNLNDFFVNLGRAPDSFRVSRREIIENCTLDCQRRVKDKYFISSRKRDLVAGGVATAIYFVLAIVTHIGCTSMFAGYAIMLIAPLVFAYVEFLYSLASEADEQLTSEGEEIFNKVLGLRQFIVDFTNISNVYNASVIAWDEIAILASLFGLNDCIKEIFEREGIKLEHQEIYDYLRPLDELDAIDEKIKELNWLLSDIADEGVKSEGIGENDRQSVSKRKIVNAIPLTQENVEKMVTDAGLEILSQTNMS